MSKFYLKIKFNAGVEYSWRCNRVPERYSIIDIRQGQQAGLVQFWGVPKKEVSLKITGREAPNSGQPWPNLYHFQVWQDIHGLKEFKEEMGSSYISEPIFPRDEEFDIIVQLRDEKGVHNLMHISHSDFDREKFDGYDSIKGFIEVENSRYANLVYQEYGVSNETHTMRYDKSADFWRLVKRS